MELQGVLQQLYGNGAPAMIIYGSQARKDPTNQSDIDVLLIYSYPIKPGAEITRLSAALADLNLQYQVLVSVLPISQYDYFNIESSLLKNIRREGVTLESI